MTEKTFFWRFAMLPIVLPVICVAIIWLLDGAVKLSGFFAGVLTFLAASGVIGGVPYLITIGIVFIYTRFFTGDEAPYVRIGLLMPILFTGVMHMSVVVLSVVDDLKSQRSDTRSFLQVNLDFLALDLLSFVVASVYTLIGFILLNRVRKKNDGLTGK